MLTAYLDESSDDRVYTVAGFMAEEQTWQNFSAEWNETLKAPPAITHFKMNSVRTTKLNGVFRNLPLQQRIDKAEVLIAVLNKYLSSKTDFAGSTVMDVRAYKEILEPVLPPKLRNPYLRCFQGILVSYTSWIKETLPTEKIKFVFDDNKKEFREAIKLYRSVADLPNFVEFKPFIGTITPGDDRTTPPIQAADLLAGQVRMHGMDPASATFMPSIIKSERLQFSYLLGKNRLAQMRGTMQATTAWLEELNIPC
jgi:hypothetical protein